MNTNFTVTSNETEEGHAMEQKLKIKSLQSRNKTYIEPREYGEKEVNWFPISAFRDMQVFKLFIYWLKKRVERAGLAQWWEH